MAVHCCPFLLPLLNTALDCFFASFPCTLLALFASRTIALSVSSYFFCSFPFPLLPSTHQQSHAGHQLTFNHSFLALVNLSFFFLDGTLPTCSGSKCCTTLRATRARFSSLFSILSFSTSVRTGLCCLLYFLFSSNGSAVGSSMKGVEIRADELPAAASTA